ncbi:MAG TPA: response regulator [Candidatus Limnocylindrales bacterium]|nr:response regulator [Candidatus Limnocylindrales bacterium]
MAAGSVILAVEDDARNAALLEAVLGPTGHELHVASSLAGARAWLAANTARTILLDRHLGDGDGLSLLADIRASEANRAAHVVLVSASVMDADRADALAAGCDAFLPKPIRIRELLAEVGPA